MGKEIERKFILLGKDVRLGEGKEIEQYYLPSEKGTEKRYRKIIKNNETKYFFTEKSSGGGLIREEKEYEISADEFESHKKESIGFGIHKTRYIVGDWEIDKYLFGMNENLFIGEVEYSSEKESEGIPNLPCGFEIVREVTGYEEWSNFSIATRGFPRKSDMIECACGEIGHTVLSLENNNVFSIEYSLTKVYSSENIFDKMKNFFSRVKQVFQNKIELEYDILLDCDTIHKFLDWMSIVGENDLSFKKDEFLYYIEDLVLVTFKDVGFWKVMEFLFEGYMTVRVHKMLYYPENEIYTYVNS